MLGGAEAVMVGQAGRECRAIMWIIIIMTLMTMMIVQMMMMMPMIMMSKGGWAGVSHYLGHGRPRLGRQCQYSHTQSCTVRINADKQGTTWRILKQLINCQVFTPSPRFTTRIVWVSLRCGSQGGFEPLLRTRPKGGDLNFQYLCLTHTNTN